MHLATATLVALTLELHLSTVLDGRHTVIVEAVLHLVGLSNQLLVIAEGILAVAILAVHLHDIELLSESHLLLAGEMSTSILVVGDEGDLIDGEVVLVIATGLLLQHSSDGLSTELVLLLAAEAEVGVESAVHVHRLLMHHSIEGETVVNGGEVQILTHSLIGTAVLNVSGHNVLSSRAEVVGVAGKLMGILVLLSEGGLKEREARSQAKEANEVQSKHTHVIITNGELGKRWKLPHCVTNIVSLMLAYYFRQFFIFIEATIFHNKRKYSTNDFTIPIAMMS